MAVVNQPGGFSIIRPADLQDGSLFKLNASLQFLYGQVAILTQALNWNNYVPTVTAASPMTATGITVNRAQYQKNSTFVTLSLDISAVLGGTLGNAFYITLPVAPDSLTVQYGCGAEFVTPSVASAAATITGGIIHVSQYNGANYTAGTWEVVISAVYRIS